MLVCKYKYWMRDCRHNSTATASATAGRRVEMGCRVPKGAPLVAILFLCCVSCGKGRCPPKSGGGGAKGKCPKDTLKFGVCGSWLGLITEQIGAKPSKECCSLLKGLADVEAALCLCSVVKEDLLGVVQIEVPVALSLIVNSCGRTVPQGFVCPK